MKFAFLFLLSFLPSLFFAQRQYLDATLTTNEGLKISGKIAAENWLTTPRSIDFKAENGDSKTYRVSDLSAFEATRHDGGKLIFVRHECEIEVSPTQLRELDNDQQLEFKQDTSWHQLLYQGAWSLYMMVDDAKKTHYFIETADEPVTEIIYKPWVREISGLKYVDGVEICRKQLYDLGQGCPEVLKLATGHGLIGRKKLKMERKGLLEIFAAYDRCKDTENTYRLRDEKNLAMGRIMAGFQVANVNFKPDIDNAYFDNIHSFQIGFNLELFLSASNKRVSFFTEMAGYHLKGGTNLKQTFFGVYSTVRGNYETWQLANYSMASVRITKSLLAPKLKIGVVNRFNIAPKYTFDYYIQDKLIKTERPKNIRDAYEIGPCIGLSAEYNRLGLEVRYGISNFLYWYSLGKGANTRTLALNASYRLF
jgi:hypothetical protein